MDLGPIQLIVIGFDTVDRFKGEIWHELEEAKRRGIIRILDLMFVMKDETGQITAFENSVLSEAEKLEMGSLVAKMIGMEERAKAAIEVGTLVQAKHEYGLTDEDIQALSQRIEPGTATGLLLIEHVWATGLKKATREAGGRTLVQGFLTPDALLVVGQELLAVQEARITIEDAEARKGEALLDALATVATMEKVKEAAVEEAVVTVAAAEMIKAVAVAEVMQILIEAKLIEEAATQYAIEALVASGLLEATLVEQAADVVAQAEAVAKTCSINNKPVAVPGSIRWDRA